MSRTVIVVRTADRPEVLNRCLAAAVDGCDVARGAYWLILDDSSPADRVVTREIVDSWKRLGLRLNYVDKTFEEHIANSLPEPALRGLFTHIIARSSTCPTEGGRNLGLILGLSLNPDMLFFMDDDMVHRHEENCFFHWCAHNRRPDSFIAAPQRRGIIDMAYLDRLVRVLDRDDWPQFLSDTSVSSDPDSWYSPKSPFWEGDAETNRVLSVATERDVVSGQFMVLRNNGAEWLPFPGGFNSDINWSILQSTYFRTPLLWVSGINAQHLPPRLPHPNAEAILSEFIGTAITRALLQIEPGGEPPMSALAVQLPDVLHRELKGGLLLFLNVERAVLFRTRTSSIDAGRTVSKIGTTLANVGERLKSIDPRKLANEWLDDFATRSKMFLEFRRNETAQPQIRRILFVDQVAL